MSNSPSKGTALMACTRFSLDRSTSSLWRVTFDNPPINLIDPVMIVELHHLLTEIEQDNRVAVVVFDSADPDFFLAHYDIAADQSAFDALPAAPTPFHHWADFLIRLGKSPAVTITALRGRARAAGSEFALATEQDLERPPATDDAWQTGRGPAPGHRSEADLELPARPAPDWRTGCRWRGRTRCPHREPCPAER